ncbi:ATP-binding protein [Dyadobacter sp. CY312]|uniref:tetratricopeptide repeat-containing sensor histidine kinase n=1 Tax=Dyadobacter sp. CY312 TaxID=2907303 RepID=UPI001F4351BA|nr:ATP-binding protein [Dyadobacter sp. CY312]MCE7043281.1 HAMP domain-containing histidine kinase [Dyadobacter sp. CY312]
MKFNILLITFLLFFKICSAQSNTHQQQLEKIKKECESIQAAFSGNPGSFEELVKKANEGLALSKEDEHEYRFAFHMAAGSGYYYQQNFEKTKDEFEKAYREAEKAKLLEKSTKPLGHLVSVYFYLGQTDKADEAARKLKQIADANPSLPNLSDIYYNLGMYNQQQKMYFSIALGHFLKSAELQKASVDTSTTHKTKLDYGLKLMMVSEIYLYLKQPEKALEYLKMTEPYLGQSSVVHIAVYGKYVRSYVLLDNRAEALKYYNKLFETAKKIPGKWSELVSSNLKMSEMEIKHKNYPQAKSYIDKANKQALIDNKPIMTTSVNLAYGDYYKEIGQPEKAVSYYRNSAKASAQFNKEQYAELLKSLTEIEITLGETKQAAATYKQYIAVADSLNQEKIALNIAEMEAVFQNKSKQVQINDQQTELDFNKKQKLWLAGAAGLLGLVVLLLVVIYRNKRKAADSLDTKNKELEKVVFALNEANQTKAKLFSIISHDLRSPISQVYQFLKLQQLNPKLLNETQRSELSEKIQTATGTLLETMEDLLLWSKTQMNQFTTDIQPTELFQLTNQCIALLKLNMDARNIRTNNFIPEKSIIQTDPSYLQTIVRNLLQNAVKASEEGGLITLGFTSEPDRQTLWIENSGPPFTQEAYRNIISQKNNGQGLSGLGLRLIDELSEKTGLKIAFENPGENLTRALIVFGER